MHTTKPSLNHIFLDLSDRATPQLGLIPRYYR